MAYVLRRLLLAPVFMFGAVTAVFLVMRVLPGDPAIAMLGDEVQPAALEAFRQRTGLDQPLAQQYLVVLGRAFTLDLGVSLQTGAPVASRIGDVLPYTLQLVGAATIVGVLLGVTLGVAAAFRQGSAVDSLVAAYVGLIGGTPGYVMAIVLLLVFAVALRWFPVITTQPESPFSPEALRALVLPALGLGLAESAAIARIARSAAADVLSSALFVSALRARGIAEWRVRYVHVLRNALVPVMAIVGTQVSTLIAGSVLVETVFNRPGVGVVLVNGLKLRDFPVVESTLLVLSGMVILVGLCSDLLSSLVDPRISYR
jgi:glutathione transport system permease protein